ncbi:DUF3352 domain-containing protein [Ornithinimicrobium sp. Arc0846-15]|nr:DUF3352 domain-containing protein [Ornithinimicrobium laminariae]
MSYANANYGQVSGRLSKGVWLLITLALIFSLVIIGGAIAAVQVLSGGGDKPSSALPQESIGYLELDLDPSASQKLSALSFISEIDIEELDDMKSGDGFGSLINEGFASDPELAGMTYEEDVEPWLGQRAGIAGLMVDGEPEPIPVLAVQVTDEDAAREFFETPGVADESGEFTFTGDYLVITDAGHLTSYESAMDEGSLDDNDKFNEAMSELGDKGIMTVWGDYAALSELEDAQVAMDDFGVEEDFGLEDDMANAYGLSPEDYADASAAMTIRFGDDYLEMYGVTVGVDSPVDLSGDSAHLIGDLPDDTSFALGVENGDVLANHAWDQFATSFPDEAQSLVDEAAYEGFELPRDIATVFGNSMTISGGPSVGTQFDEMANDGTSGTVDLGYQADTDVERLNELWFALTAGQDVSPVVVGDDGDVWRMTGGQPYLDQLADGGSLTGSDVFETAVPEAEDAQFVAFVNIDNFESMYLDEVPAEGRSAIESIAAVGMTSQLSEDGNGSFSLRVVANN